jgi:hypothetical protein
MIGLKYAFYFIIGVTVLILSDKLMDEFYEKKQKENFKKEK